MSPVAELAPADAAAPRARPAADPLPCAHCGTPVPAARAAPGALAFCCAGCASVHALLHEQGLSGYYRLAQDEVRPARTTDRSYAELDQEAVQTLYVRPAGGPPGGPPGPWRTVELYLEGVHCGACVWLVEKLPALLPGVREARLEVGRSLARVTWDPAAVSLSAIARRLDAFGYPAHPFREVRAREARRREERAALVRIAIAGALAGNVMLMAFALYGGLLAGMEPLYEQLFRWGSLLLAVPSVLGPGSVFLRGAWGALRARSLSMDVPLALGILAGLVWGAVNTVRGTGEIYFDTVTVLVFALLVGRALERRQQRRAADATELLQALQPTSARRVDPDGERVEEVALEALEPGDVVEVRAGEALPADGEVVAGSSHLDLSLLTGESRPVAVEAGARVHAGTMNRTARLRVRVEQTGRETRVGRLLRSVEEQGQRKAPVVRMADRIAGSFVAAVLALALVTALLWLQASPGEAVDRVVALLVVTCPCALGLATPLALSVALGQAARRGMIVRGGDAIERLSRPGRLWLDKTGTLTEGRMRLLDWVGPDAARRAVLALEAHAAHPLAEGFREAFAGLEAAPVDEPPRHTGQGLVGRVEGREVRVGAAGWVLAEAGAPPAWVGELVTRALGAARTPLLVAIDGQVVAGAAFGDPLRRDARPVLERLRARGWQVGVLSGDHPEVVAAVAAELGLEPGLAAGGLSPEDKRARVLASAGAGPVVMVGDGVNDAAALAAADVGIGVRGGAEATLAAADVFLTRPELGALSELLDGARSTLRTVRRNLVISIFYNAVAATLAVAGLIDPLVAAVLMPISSLSVVASSAAAWSGARGGGGSWRSS